MTMDLVNTTKCTLPQNTKSFCQHPYKRQWYVTYKQNGNLYLALIDIVNSEILDFTLIPTSLKFDVQIFSITSSNKSKIFVGLINESGTVVIFEDKILDGLTHYRTIQVFENSGVNTTKQFLITVSKNRKHSFCFISSPEIQHIYFIPVSYTSNSRNSLILKDVRMQQQKDAIMHSSKVCSVLYSSSRMTLYVGRENNQVEVWSCKSLFPNKSTTINVEENISGCHIVYTIKALVGRPHYLLIDKRNSQLLVFQERSNYQTEVGIFNLTNKSNDFMRSQKTTGDATPTKRNISQSKVNSKINNKNVSNHNDLEIPNTKVASPSLILNDNVKRHIPNSKNVSPENSPGSASNDTNTISVIEKCTVADFSVQISRGNLLNAWVHPVTSIICCLFSDLSCKYIFFNNEGNIQQSDATCQTLSILLSSIKANIITLKHCSSKGDTSLINRTSFSLIIEQNNAENDSIQSKECCGYVFSPINMDAESMISHEISPTTTSYSIPFDRYLVKDTNNDGSNNSSVDLFDHIVFADKEILVNGKCRINIFVHSCLTHKSTLAVSFMVDNGKNLTLEKICLDKSKQYFLLRLLNINHSYEKDQSHTLVYGSIDLHSSTPGTDKNSKKENVSTSKSSHGKQPNINIINGMTDGVFVYSKAGTFIFFLSKDGKNGECVFVKNGKKQVYNVQNGISFKKIEFAPKSKTKFSTNVIVEFYDAKRQINCIGISSLKKGNTVGVGDHVKLSRDEKVLDIAWQNNDTFIDTNEIFVQLFKSEKDNSFDATAQEIFTKRYAAILTTENIIVIDRNCKVFSRIPLKSANGHIKNILSISWIGFSIVISERHSSSLKYVTMSGRIRPLCSTVETSSAIKICNVLSDRISYAVCNSHNDAGGGSNSKGRSKKQNIKTKIFTRPLLPLEALVVGLIDHTAIINDHSNSNNKSAKISKYLPKLIFFIVKNFTIVNDERYGGIDDSHDGPSEDAGITALTVATLARAGLEECAMYLFRPEGILPLSAAKPQIFPVNRCEVAIASDNMRASLEELLAAETELRDYALNPNAGLSSVGAMPSRYSKLSQYLKNFSRASFALGRFELAATCLDIAGDDMMLYNLLVTTGKHGTSVLNALLNTITVTSRDPRLKSAINAYMNIHGFNIDNSGKSSSSNRRKRRAQTTKELSFHVRELEHYSRRGALLGIGMGDLRLPSWDTKSKTQAKRNELLQTHVPSFDPRNGIMKPLALDTESSWVGEEQPNAAEPVKEQRKFGHESSDASSTHNIRDKTSETGNDGQQSNQKQQQTPNDNSESPLSKITGGADPECAIVLYVRFEEKNEFDKGVKQYAQRDSGPYDNNCYIFGSEKNCSWTDEDSPVDDVSRKQHQHIICFQRGEDDSNNKVVTNPTGAGDVEWSIRLMIADSLTLQLGFHQSLRHRNHRFATYELWVRKNIPDESVILGVGGGLSKDLKTRDSNVAWAWSLIMTKTGLRFETSSGSKVAGDSINDESEQRNICNKWIHVALTIDALRSPPHICLYIDGKLIADGSVDEPKGNHTFNSDPTAALYIAPNFTGEITEIRVWALVRPQDQIYANREWPLKMAKKKRKNRLQGIKIVANNKNQLNVDSGGAKPLVKLSGLSSGKGRGRRARKKTVVKK